MSYNVLVTEGVGIKVGGATERTMPIQLPVLLFLAIYSQASPAPLLVPVHSAIINSFPGFDAGGKTFPEIGTGAGEV